MTRIVAFLLICGSAASSTVAEDRLPKVLILGDFVYQQPAGEVAKELKGIAEVTYPVRVAGEVRSTTSMLNDLDRLLGRHDRSGHLLAEEDWPDWDVIYLNCGLGDLVCRAPRMASIRIMPMHAGGVRNTSPEKYERNLNELVTKLEATGAKLIWGSTTPIRASSTNVFQLQSEVEYNAIAEKVMTGRTLLICDMYTHVKGVIDMDKPASHGADPFHFDRKPIHEPMTKSIRQALLLPAKVSCF